MKKLKTFVSLIVSCIVFSFVFSFAAGCIDDTDSSKRFAVENVPTSVTEEDNTFFFVPKTSGIYHFYSTGTSMPSVDVFNNKGTRIAYDYGVQYVNGTHASIVIFLLMNTAYSIESSFSFTTDHGDTKIHIEKFVYPRIVTNVSTTLDKVHNHFEFVAEHSGNYNFSFPSSGGIVSVSLKVFDKDFNLISNSTASSQYYNQYFEAGESYYYKVSYFHDGSDIQGTALIGFK